MDEQFTEREIERAVDLGAGEQVGSVATAPDGGSVGARPGAAELLDNPLALVAFSAVALGVLVWAADFAAQGRLWALAPALVVVGLYVVTVRRWAAKRR